MTESDQTSKQPSDQPEEEYVAMQDDEWQDPDLPNTVPSGDTVEADRRDAEMQGAADDPPTPEEEAAAPEGPVSPEVAEAERASIERGANVEGEGQIS